MRIAAIDIGTNSVHMIIARVHPHGRFEIVESSKEMVRLGRGGLTEGLLMPDAQDRAIAALHRMHKLATAKGADEIVAVATSAVREAHNGGEFLGRALDEVGLRVQVIQGSEEARLIYLAVREQVDFGGKPALLIDIGGGSVEFILATSQKPLFMRSAKIGVARLKEMFTTKDPFSPREVRAMATHVRTILLGLRRQLREAGAFATVVGTSGTILNLCAMGTAAAKRPFADTRDGLTLTRREIKALSEKLPKLNPKAREKVPQYDPKRGDLTVVGAILLEQIFEVFGIKQLTSCDRALREGVILDYIETHRPDLLMAEAEPNLRRRSVRSLLYRYKGEGEHIERVVQFALKLFDGTRAVHKLTQADRELLEFATYLHDIGYYISAEQHHKHSAYLITQSRMPGFTQKDQHFIALLCRYHRKNKSKPEHADYQALPSAERRRLKILAALLKLADGLDRSHSGSIKDVVVTASKTRVRVVAVSESDPELEIWAATRNSEMLSEELKRPIVIERKA